jgi:hypothetical protein
LAGLGSGIVTGFLLLGLLRLHRHLLWRQLQTRQRSEFEPGFESEFESGFAPKPETDPWPNQPPQGSPVPRDAPPRSRPVPGGEFPRRSETPPVDQANYLRDDWSYEIDQKPQSGSQSGSSYSYSYRPGEAAAGGKRESVYDADYRVIIPPPASGEENDDFEDDEQEDEDQPRRHR